MNFTEDKNLIYFEDKNLITKHENLVDTVFLQMRKKEFFFQNIFHEKFKYLLFVEESDIHGYFFENIKYYLNEVDESDFFVQSLNSEKYIIPYSIDKTNVLGYENFKQSEGEFGIIPSDYFMGLNKVCLEYLYYSEITKWCGYFNTVEDIGIFAFETEELATKFMDNFSEEFFFSPQEFCRSIWPYIKENCRKAFLENYSHLSYLKKGVWHRGLLCDTERGACNK